MQLNLHVTSTDDDMFERDSSLKHHVRSKVKQKTLLARLPHS